MKTAVFRTDASRKIATGHVMRSLALADQLREDGTDVRFICRMLDGNLCNFISGKGYTVHALPVAEQEYTHRPGDPAHAHWLECPWEHDAAQTAEILRDLKPDWLVVDHYGLDARWMGRMREHTGRILVIDDLFDRPLDCDILLDHTFGHTPENYVHRTPESCLRLTGTAYGLLRPEFAALREESLKRDRREIKHLLIAMGGMNTAGANEKVLDALPVDALPKDCRITVVTGGRAPGLAETRALAEALPLAAEVRTDVGDMASLMAQSDAGIGASGGTMWERACLGVPTLTTTLADNQAELTRDLARQGYAADGGDLRAIARGDLSARLRAFFTDTAGRMAMAQKGAALCDGLGIRRIITEMKGLTHEVRTAPNRPRAQAVHHR